MKTTAITNFNFNYVNLFPNLSKKNDFGIKEDAVSFSGIYSDRTITELAPIMRKELYSLKKTPAKTPFEKGRVSYKRYIYQKLLDLYEQYIKGSFNRETAENIRRIEAERKEYIKNSKKGNNLSGGLGEYIDKYLGYPIFTKLTVKTNNANRLRRMKAKEDFHNGRIAAAKSPLVKEMLDRLGLIADDYINGNGIYFDKISLTKNSISNENIIPKAQSPIKQENFIKRKTISEMTPEEIKNLRLVSAYEKLSAEQAVYSDCLAKNWTQSDKDSYREITDKLVEIEDTIVNENISLIPKKNVTDFSKSSPLKEREIHYYMHNKVFPNMTKNEASAIDGMEMFEIFGKKEDGRIGSTIFSMALDLARLPQQHKTEKVFSKYLDVIEQFGERGNYEDAHSVAVVLTDFTKMENPNEISKESILRAIDMIKDYSQGSKKVRFVYNALSTSKHGNDADIKYSLQELLKMMKSRKN